uniref:Apple domain-containing protein n=1 Tax=Elaeophora elaphi TaxID=1147741 RepID=A0A0R3S3W6_9BILA
MLAIIFACLLQSANGQYSIITDSIDVTADAGYEGELDDDYKKPTVPVTPPRVPIRDGPSLGYRPPPPPIRRDAKSSGKCSFDHNSWRFEPQTAIANAIMFERTTGTTCENCVEKCLSFQDPNSEWICRSLTFDHHWKICDLFAVNGTNPPHFLTEYFDRDYLEYIHQNNKTYLQTSPPSNVHSNQDLNFSDVGEKEYSYQTVPQKIERAEADYRSDSSTGYQASPVHRKSDSKSSEKLCRDEDLTRYIMISDYERLNSATDTQLVKGETLKECARACDRDETLTCSSVIHRGKECELSVSKAAHKSSDDFIFKENSTYLEKFCLPASSAEATEKLWPTVLDHILVGHVMEVIDATSLTECMATCLHAEQEFSFVCRSAMWYPNDEDQNCLLNTESRETHPDVFIAEDQGVRMFYFEVPRIRNKEVSDVFRDDPVEDDFTRWSSCDSSNLQHRYLKCKEQMDVRKCPQQTKFCKQELTTIINFRLNLGPNMLRKGKCLAVRDSNGRKKCPHGIRKAPGGHVVYCKNPIDCKL